MDEQTLKRAEELYKRGWSCYRIAKELGYCGETINKHMKRLGYDISGGRKKRDDPLVNHKDEIVAAYLSGIGSTRLANKYKTSDGNIQKLLKRAGVTIRPQRKNPINENYFEVMDKSIQFWILGLIHAAGGVNKNGFNLSLSEDILNKVYDELELKRGEKFCSRKICSKLLSLGCSPAREPDRKNLPTTILDSPHFVDFMRGYYEAVGSELSIPVEPSIVESLQSKLTELGLSYKIVLTRKLIPQKYTIYFNQDFLDWMYNN